MKTRKIVRAIILTMAAVITLSSLSGCIIVPVHGYGGSHMMYHGWER